MPKTYCAVDVFKLGLQPGHVGYHQPSGSGRESPIPCSGLSQRGAPSVSRRQVTQLSRYDYVFYEDTSATSVSRYCTSHCITATALYCAYSLACRLYGSLVYVGLRTTIYERWVPQPRRRLFLALAFLGTPAP